MPNDYLPPLATLRQIVAKATPGAWKIMTTDSVDGGTRSHLRTDDLQWIAEVRRGHEGDEQFLETFSPTLVTHLLDVLQAQRAALRAVDDWRGLDGDGISDPVRSKLKAALALLPESPTHG